MTDETLDQSAGAEVETLPDAEEAEVEAPEIQYDEDGNPIEDDADLDEWTDDKGRVHKVPKALKEAELRQADYTRKTQELAEQRKAIAAANEQAAKLLELRNAVIAEQAELKAIEKSEAEWRAFQPRTPEEAEERRDRLDDLRFQREQTAQAMQQKAYQATQEAQHHDAKALADMRAELPKVIPGFTPELERQIAAFATTDLGFQPEEISAVRDPKIVKVLHLAMLGAKQARQTTAAKAVQKQQATAPAPTVSGKSAPITGLSDKLTADEWVRRREAQLAKSGRR